MTEYVKNVVSEEPEESFGFNLTLKEWGDIYNQNNERLKNHHDLFDTKLKDYYKAK